MNMKAYLHNVPLYIRNNGVIDFARMQREQLANYDYITLLGPNGYITIESETLRRIQDIQIYIYTTPDGVQTGKCAIIYEISNTAYNTTYDTGIDYGDYDGS